MLSAFVLESSEERPTKISKQEIEAVKARAWSIGRTWERTVRLDLINYESTRELSRPVEFAVAAGRMDTPQQLFSMRAAGATGKGRLVGCPISHPWRLHAHRFAQPCKPRFQWCGRTCWQGLNRALIFPIGTEYSVRSTNSKVFLLGWVPETMFSDCRRIKKVIYNVSQPRSITVQRPQLVPHL